MCMYNDVVICIISSFSLASPTLTVSPLPCSCPPLL